MRDLSQVIADLRQSTCRLKVRRLQLPHPGELFHQLPSLLPSFTPLSDLNGERLVVPRLDILIVVGAEFDRVDREDQKVDTFSVIFFSASMQRLLKTIAFDETDGRRLFDFWFKVVT